MSNSPFLIVMTNAPSERMMNWFLKVLHDECKIDITDCQFIYMIDEPPKGAAGKPTKEQIRSAWDRFSKEIVGASPKVTLVLGAPCLYYLTGIRENINDTRGYALSKKYFRPLEWETYQQIGNYKTSNKKRGITKGDPRYGWVDGSIPGLANSFNSFIIPTFQLDHVCAGFHVKPAFKEDILRAKRVLDGTIKLMDKDFTFYHNWDDFKHDGASFINDVIAVDIETHGIDNEVIDRVSFSDGVISASMEWSGETKDFLNELFKWDFMFAFHNSPFDVPRLQANGVTSLTADVVENKVFDTMFAAVTLQPDLAKGLGRAVTIYLDCEPWKWKTLSSAYPVFYSAKDAFMTVWLAKQEIKLMKSMGIWDLFMGKNAHPGPGVMATIPVLTEMNRKGIKTNREFAQWWVGKLERRLLKYHKLWTKMFGEINSHSPKQIQELLYKTWKLPIQKSREDRTSTNELSLVKLKNYIISNYAQVHDNNIWKSDPRCHPRTFDLILKLRDCAKTISTYVQPVADSESTWVHPSYVPVSKDDDSKTSKGNTSTGRLATIKPNIGNQPDKVRKIYIPDTPDDAFIQLDWKMAELYAFAYGGDDQRLLNDLRSEDMHQKNADRYGTTRDTAKNVIYASQYLAGPAKVNEMILAQEHKYVPVEECRRIMNGYKQYYYNVTALKNHLIDLCNTKHYIINPFGRVRFFHNNEAPAAVDFYAQSIVADCLWCILKPISDKAKEFGGRLITTVYDSVLVQVPKEMVAAAARELKKIMETPFPNVALGFVLPCEIEIGEAGKSWGELKKVKI